MRRIASRSLRGEPITQAQARMRSTDISRVDPVSTVSNHESGQEERYLSTLEVSREGRRQESQDRLVAENTEPVVIRGSDGVYRSRNNAASVISASVQLQQPDRESVTSREAPVSPSRVILRAHARSAASIVIGAYSGGGADDDETSQSTPSSAHSEPGAGEQHEIFFEEDRSDYSEQMVEGTEDEHDSRGESEEDSANTNSSEHEVMEVEEIPPRSSISSDDAGVSERRDEFIVRTGRYRRSAESQNILRNDFTHRQYSVSLQQDDSSEVLIAICPITGENFDFRLLRTVFLA